MSTLVIPQEATELTLDELKLISGGNYHWHKKPNCKLVKKIVIIKKIFKCDEEPKSAPHGHESANNCDK